METKTEVSVDTAGILRDYRIAVESREASLIGRREVLTGKAKFGIFGDGKEVAQVAMARAFQPGDWRSGYYRDQTLMFALDLLTIQEFFAQLFAHANIQAEPSSAGRQMNAHFSTSLLDSDGRWLNLAERRNVSADISPTGAQMPRLVGLAYASRLYRELDSLHQMASFSNNGNEIAWGTIGNASTAEGMFWEAVNAIGVLKAPAVIAIWDDDYGISVPNEFQITKQNLSEVLSGFQREPDTDEGYDIYTVKGWDYPALVETFGEAAETARVEHVPAIVHVIEVTQPQGHSTSGSHERYKPDERLVWEVEHDCIRQMRMWLLDEGHASEEELTRVEKNARKTSESARKAAWLAFTEEPAGERDRLAGLLGDLEEAHGADDVGPLRAELRRVRQPMRKDVASIARRALFATRGSTSKARDRLAEWTDQRLAENSRRFGAHLYSESQASALKVPVVSPEYNDDPNEVPGFELLNRNFDALLTRYPHLVAFGEDVGHLGGVNQTFAGLQDKYGKLRISDTGIREITIIGQAIGMAMRGLRPIAEIQYLDYVLYALQIMSDDLATLRWRTVGRQHAPVIVRTRGHRLEGVWHSGSPMGGVVNLLRGLHVLVPRNMTKAAGFYNTLMQSDDPGLVIEVLNGYRLRENLPLNLGMFTVPLGVPELLRAGSDITIVTYGAMVRVVMKAAEELSSAGVEIEVIDVQSLLPFDIDHSIVKSVEKTHRVIFADEDMPGGATAYMMHEIIEKQGGFWHLDTEPRTITSQPHRPAYGSDGNYFSKPNVEDIIETVWDIMNESNPRLYPGI